MTSLPEPVPLVATPRGRVRWLRMNRPDHLNALDRAMADALRAELEATADDDRVRVLVLTGTGRSFSVGVDRQEALEASLGVGDDGELMEPSTLWPVEELYHYPKPLVCSLNGAAYGGGATLAMLADVRVASSSATLAFNMAQGGMTPELASSFLLWRQVGYATAAELVLTGRTVTADEALALRLVHRVVPDTALMAATQAVAEQIAATSPEATVAAKALLRAGLEHGFAEARAAELAALAARGAALADLDDGD